MSVTQTTTSVSPRVLLVDDDPAVRTMMSLTLENKRFTNSSSDLFGTLQKNLSALDFSLLLPDVMTIADEVDSQLTQPIESYMGVVRKPAAA